MGGSDLCVFSRRELIGTLPLSKSSPPCQASGVPSQDVKLWIRVQSGRGSMLELGISPTGQSAFFVCLSIWWGPGVGGGGGSGNSGRAGQGSAVVAVLPGGRPAVLPGGRP